MYPFSSSSLSHFHNASSYLGGNGYNLQSKVSGVSGFSVIVWSYGWDRDNFFDSTASKILACLWYSSGITTSWLNFPACLDSSMDIPLSEHSCSSSWNIALCQCPCFVRILQFLTIWAIMGLICNFLQSVEQIIMGRKEVLMVVSLHQNFGSNMESQGYPRIRSSPPRLVTRNHMISCLMPVWTSRSTQCVSAPALLVVLSMFHIFQGQSVTSR